MTNSSRFRSTTPFSDIVVFMRKQALTIIGMGIAMIAIGICMGAIVATVKSIVGGFLLLAVLIITGLGILYHGMVGLNKQLNNNRILKNAEFKELIITEDSISEEQCGTNYNHKVVSGYDNIDRVIKAKGIYQIFLSGGLLFLAKEADLIEGNIADLDAHLTACLGSKFINKASRKDTNCIGDKSSCDQTECEEVISDDTPAPTDSADTAAANIAATDDVATNVTDDVTDESL